MSLELAGDTMLLTGLQHGVLGLLLGPLGVQELMIILLIAILIFGGRKIPEIGRGLGEGIRQFKNSLKGDEPKAEPKNEETKKEAPASHEARPVS
jgi:sec-independent protein translocase protein TatA